MIKTKLAALLEAAGYTFEALLRLGLISGAAIAAVLGQLLLADCSAWGRSACFCTSSACARP